MDAREKSEEWAWSFIRTIQEKLNEKMPFRGSKSPFVFVVYTDESGNVFFDVPRGFFMSKRDFKGRNVVDAVKKFKKFLIEDLGEIKIKCDEEGFQFYATLFPTPSAEIGIKTQVGFERYVPFHDY